jgi:hypothetical protein
LGEFSLTKKFVRHGGRMQREQETATTDAQRKQSVAVTDKAPAKK